jgi:iron complex outermembrane recepter protein
VRAAYWAQRAKDEFVTIDGTPRNGGATDRRGVDTGLTWQAGERVSVWGNWTAIRAEIKRPDDSQAAFVGNRLRSIPGRTASLGASFEAGPALTARLYVDSQGDYYVNEANLGGRFGGYTLAHAAIDYRLSWGTVSVQLKNLFDRYHEYVFDFSDDGTETIHSPGNGRNASVSLSYRF